MKVLNIRRTFIDRSIDQILPKFFVKIGRYQCPSSKWVMEGEEEAMKGDKLMTWPIEPKRNFVEDASNYHFRIAESQFLRLMRVIGLIKSFLIYFRNGRGNIKL